MGRGNRCRSDVSPTSFRCQLQRRKQVFWTQNECFDHELLEFINSATQFAHQMSMLRVIVKLQSDICQVGSTFRNQPTADASYAYASLHSVSACRNTRPSCAFCAREAASWVWSRTQTKTNRCPGPLACSRRAADLQTEQDYQKAQKLHTRTQTGRQSWPITCNKSNELTLSAIWSVKHSVGFRTPAEPPHRCQP